MTPPSPLPWRTHKFDEAETIDIKDSKEDTVGIIYIDETAELIVKSVNLFPKLVEALDSVLSYCDESRDDCGLCNKGIFMGHHEGCVIPDIQELLKQARASSPERGEK